MRPQHDEEHRKLEKVVAGIVDNLWPIIEDVQKCMENIMQVMHLIRGQISFDMS